MNRMCINSLLSFINIKLLLIFIIYMINQSQLSPSKHSAELYQYIYNLKSKQPLHSNLKNIYKNYTKNHKFNSIKRIQNSGSHKLVHSQSQQQKPQIDTVQQLVNKITIQQKNISIKQKNLTFHSWKKINHIKIQFKQKKQNKNFSKNQIVKTQMNPEIHPFKFYTKLYKKNKIRSRRNTAIVLNQESQQGSIEKIQRSKTNQNKFSLSSSQNFIKGKKIDQNRLSNLKKTIILQQTQQQRLNDLQSFQNKLFQNLMLRNPEAYLRKRRQKVYSSKNKAYDSSISIPKQFYRSKKERINSADKSNKRSNISSFLTA